MFNNKAQINQLMSALEKSGRLDKLEIAQAIEMLNGVYHFLAVKNQKRAVRQLEKFTRQLVQLFQD